MSLLPRAPRSSRDLRCMNRCSVLNSISSLNEITSIAKVGGDDGNTRHELFQISLLPDGGERRAHPCIAVLRCGA